MIEEFNEEYNILKCFYYIIYVKYKYKMYSFY